jgi:hypothetical protein
MVMPWGEHVCFRGASSLKLVESAVEDLNCHFGPPDLAQTKLVLQSQNRELRRMNYRFRDCWNVSGNCKRRHEHAADLPEVCALVGRRRAEVEESFDY